ncbi:uncharacterized protein LOC128190450 [Crassostrea angulata]|uniref:uncharacterized protein LOC128190450 n=1 Tax=Magallana angulata TaxID=2784310 RepID=UPI0022B1AB29|nr:uncharacterized protein LOC128190450 [Crassostrea angulata]
MAVKCLLIFMAVAAYFQGIEARRARVRFRGGRGGGGSDFIVYLVSFGSAIIVACFFVCVLYFLPTIRRIKRYLFRLCCCCCANQQAVADAGLKNPSNKQSSDEQLDQHMLELILLAEQAKLVTYLRAQQNIEQSTADEQSGPWEQMGFSHLNSDPRTFNITEESPMTPDVQSGPWILKENPQLEFVTTSPMTSYDANVTEKTPMTSYV